MPVLTDLVNSASVVRLRNLMWTTSRPGPFLIMLPSTSSSAHSLS